MVSEVTASSLSIISIIRFSPSFHDFLSVSSTFSVQLLFSLSSISLASCVLRGDWQLLLVLYYGD